MDGKPRSLVTPEWLAPRLGSPGLRLIEIAGLRQEEMPAYRAGHVPGAVCWRWKEMLWDERMRDFPDPGEFARRMAAAGISNDTTVVVYGEDIQFGVYAWWALTYCGHPDVRLLDGGRYRWTAEGRPLEAAFPSPPQSAEYQSVERKAAMRIYRDEVQGALGDPDTLVLDARSREEYLGLRVGGPGGPDVGAVRAGRIPGAKHFYFLDLLDETKAFRPAQTLQQLVREIGGDKAERIITYCRMSHRATVAYFALAEMLGYPNVRVYDGSWTEWGNLVGVPIER
jgi:thiosulfate/3-mercaptopyruvate sulfurtransferase